MQNIDEKKRKVDGNLKVDALIKLFSWNSDAGEWQAKFDNAEDSENAGRYQELIDELLSNYGVKNTTATSLIDDSSDVPDVDGNNHESWNGKSTLIMSAWHMDKLKEISRQSTGEEQRKSGSDIPPRYYHSSSSQFSSSASSASSSASSDPEQSEVNNLTSSSP